MTPADVIRAAADRFGVPIETLTGRGRSRYVCIARQAAARDLVALGLSHGEVGAMLGGRDPSTILKNFRTFRYVERDADHAS